MDKYEFVEINSPRWFSLENLKNEEWKWIPKCEGCFLISNYGRIKRLKTNNPSHGIQKYLLKDHILRLSNCNRKRVYVGTQISFRGKHIKILVHRLVAELFIPNPLNLPEVNHKDENYHNPRFDNLEWCTHKYNLNYGTIRERWKRNFPKEVIEKRVFQYDVNGKFIKSYNSLKEAGAALNISKSMIGEVYSEKRNVYTAGGFIWTFTQDDEDVKRKVERTKNKYKHTRRGKYISQFSISGEFIATYNSITEAAKINNASIRGIQNCLKGRSRTSSNYKWKYV